MTGQRLGYIVEFYVFIFEAGHITCGIARASRGLLALQRLLHSAGYMVVPIEKKFRNPFDMIYKRKIYEYSNKMGFDKLKKLDINFNRITALPSLRGIFFNEFY